MGCGENKRATWPPESSQYSIPNALLLAVIYPLPVVSLALVLNAVDPWSTTLAVADRLSVVLPGQSSPWCRSIASSPPGSSSRPTSTPSSR